jgi:hypothetical protein
VDAGEFLRSPIISFLTSFLVLVVVELKVPPKFASKSSVIPLAPQMAMNLFTTFLTFFYPAEIWPVEPVGPVNMRKAVWFDLIHDGEKLTWLTH